VCVDDCVTEWQCMISSVFDVAFPVKVEFIPASGKEKFMSSFSNCFLFSSMSAVIYLPC